MLISHFTLFTLNRTTPFSPLHDVQQRTLLYHISSAVSLCTAPPEPRAHLVPLSCIDLPPCTACRHPPVQTCAFFCLHSRSFHVTPLFLFEVSDPRSHHSLRSDLAASHNGRFFMPSAYPPSVQHIYNHSARTTWTMPSLSLFCLDLRCPAGCLSYPPSCLTLQHTYIPLPASHT